MSKAIPASPQIMQYSVYVWRIIFVRNCSTEWLLHFWIVQVLCSSMIQEKLCSTLIQYAFVCVLSVPHTSLIFEATSKLSLIY